MVNIYVIVVLSHCTDGFMPLNISKVHAEEHSLLIFDYDKMLYN